MIDALVGKATKAAKGNPAISRFAVFVLVCEFRVPRFAQVSGEMRVRLPAQTAAD